VFQLTRADVSLSDELFATVSNSELRASVTAFMLKLRIPRNWPRARSSQIPEICALCASIREVTRMKAAENNPIKNREELKNKRKVLFKLFLRNPMYTSLAVEIKALDDQLADWTHLLARK
jgi:hypothetical protein